MDATLPLPLASLSFEIQEDFTVDQLAKPLYEASQAFAKIAGSALQRGILTPADAPMLSLMQASANLLQGAQAISQAIRQANQARGGEILVPSGGRPVDPRFRN